MSVDRSFVESNRAATNRLRDLVGRLSDTDMQRPVGEHWTVAVTLAHLAFWDERVMYILDLKEREGRVLTPDIPHAVNDISLPLMRAIPPREAARLAVESATALDRRLESFPPDQLAELLEHNKRWVLRSMHRGEHLDEVDAALKG